MQKLKHFPHICLHTFGASSGAWGGPRRRRPPPCMSFLSRAAIGPGRVPLLPSSMPDWRQDAEGAHGAGFPSAESVTTERTPVAFANIPNGCRGFQKVEWWVGTGARVRGSGGRGCQKPKGPRREVAVWTRRDRRGDRFR